MILRIAPRPQWTTLPQALYNDDRLSYGALGLLTFLLSRPDDWEVRISALANARNCSRYAVEQLLTELRAAGYAVLKRGRGEGGRLAGSFYVIHDGPVEAGVDDVDVDVPAGKREPAQASKPAATAPAALTAQEQAYVDAYGPSTLAALNTFQRDLLNACDDVEALVETLNGWRGNDYRPTSVAGIRDRYQRTVKDRAQATAGTGGRGAKGPKVGRDRHARDEMTVDDVQADTDRARALLFGTTSGDGAFDDVEAFDVGFGQEHE